MLKVDKCPNCNAGKISNTVTKGNWTETTHILDGLPSDACRNCEGTGKLESTVDLQDALKDLGIIK